MNVLPSYVLNALRDETFIRYGLLFAAGLVVLLWMGLALRRAGRGRARATLARDQSGTAVVEFALMFPVAFMVVLVMIQLMVLMAALVVVNYAAYAAARAAIVWVPQDLAVQGAFGAERENEVIAPDYSYKLHMIHAAAAIACLPVAGRTDQPAAGVSADALDGMLQGLRNYYAQGQPANWNEPNWMTPDSSGKSLLGRKFAYAWNHTYVQLDDWTAPSTVYDRHADIRVIVHHDFQLNVPLASALFAGTQGDRTHIFSSGQTADGYVTRITGVQTLTNEGVTDQIDPDPNS